MLSWLKATLRNHFGFSKAETQGTLVLLLLTVFFLLAPPCLQWYANRQPVANNAADIAQLEQTLSLLKERAQPERPTTYKRPTTHKKQRAYSPQPIATFDINTATEAQLTAIRGIGPTLSARIIKFRDKLGGFISQAQYQEVYGLEPAVVAALKQQTRIRASFQPTKLNINTAAVKTLAAHPYITYQQAKSKKPMLVGQYQAIIRLFLMACPQMG